MNKETDTNSIYNQIRESLKKFTGAKSETVKLAQPTIDPITINDINLYDLAGKVQDTITITGSNYSNTTVHSGGYIAGAGVSIGNAGAGGGPYFTSINNGTGYTSPWASVNTAGSTKINLTGEDADIDINGKSLSKTIQALEERLNVLVPNPKLEAEWAELKELGDKYRALEAKLLEQGKMWEKLKEMPPPQPLYK